MPSLCALLACATAMPTAAAPPAEVTVYRCTGADGRVAIGDTPCASGERQQVRTMLRPVDGTPMARPAPAPAGTVAAPPAPQVIVLRPPQPMYRCVRPDGTTYTSDTSDGNPRWVPLWTEGYGAYRRGTSTRVEVSAGSGGGRVGIDNRLRGGRVPDRGFYGAGTWIRDECRPLPQSEVCSILGTRREEIRRRFFNAQPTERAELGGEERSITARLAQDCER